MEVLPQSPHEADQNPQNKNAEPTPTTTKSVPLMDIVPLVALASLLIDIAPRIEGAVDAVEEVADLVLFMKCPSRSYTKKKNHLTACNFTGSFSHLLHLWAPNSSPLPFLPLILQKVSSLSLWVIVVPSPHPYPKYQQHQLRLPHHFSWDICFKSAIPALFFSNKVSLPNLGSHSNLFSALQRKKPQKALQTIIHVNILNALHQPQKNPFDILKHDGILESCWSISVTVGEEEYITGSGTIRTDI